MTETTTQEAEVETTEATTTGTQTLEQAQAELAAAQKHIKDLNKENADRRKKLETFEADKATKEAASLSDLEKAKAELGKLTPELEKLRKENQALLLRGKFERTSRELKLEFANETAQDDAYRLLDPDTVGEDGSGIKDAITALQKERPYLFVRLLAPETDARQKGKTSGEITSTETLARKRQEYGSL